MDTVNDGADVDDSLNTAGGGDVVPSGRDNDGECAPSVIAAEEVDTLDSPDGGQPSDGDTQRSAESESGKALGGGDSPADPKATGDDLDNREPKGDGKGGSDSAEDGRNPDSTSDLFEDVNLQDKDTGNTKLHTAAMAFDRKAVKELLNSGASVDRLNFKNRSAFHEMTLAYLNFDIIGQAEWRKSFKDILDLLVQHGLDVNDRDVDNRTPLHYVAPYPEHEKLVKHFVETLVDIDVGVKDKYKQTPLHLAVASNTYDVVTMLVVKRRDILNAPDQAGQTPLHIAAKGRRKQMEISHMVKYGAGVDKSDYGGRTPLHLASKWGRVENVEILLDKGAKVFNLDHTGQSSLHYAAAKDVTGRCVQCILSYCDENPRLVLLNLQDAIGRETALHMAIRLHMFENIKVLMRQGPDVNLQDMHGESVLHRAVCCRELFVWKALMSLHGDVRLQNDALMSPYQKACKAKNHNAIALMVQHAPPETG